MKMILKEYLQKATKEHWAVGHFNIATLGQMRAVVEAAKEAKSPVMIGTSQGERSFIGLHQVVALIETFRKETKLPLFLNADHTKSFKACKEAVDAGYDSIHIDGSELAYEENKVVTKQVVEYAQEVAARESRKIMVEGELGYLRGSSKVQKQIIELKKEDYTDPGQAVEFVQSTGVGRLAIVIGNLHGVAFNKPQLDFERIRDGRAQISQETTLVLHGGSGMTPEDFKKSIKAGIANIHINTELRVAYHDALEDEFKEHPEEVVPYKYFSGAIEAMKEKVKEKLQIFGAYGKV
jgi:fructose-bisphosphate aldolase, class II